MDEQRVDKWLWCARFFKTRSLAADAVRNGRVAVNGRRAKPATNVHVDDDIVIEKSPFEFHITVRGISPQRRNASGAQALFEEDPESQIERARKSEQLKLANAMHSTKYGKLNKKERREREKIKRDY